MGRRVFEPTFTTESTTTLALSPKDRWNKAKRRGPLPLLSVVLVGIAASFVTSGMDISIIKLRDFMNKTEERIGVGFASFSLRTLFAIVLCLIAVTFACIAGKEAIGSGIPELESILAGDISPSFFGIGVLFAKIIGLVMVLSAGLSVGREGPNTHIAACLAFLILRTRLFRNVGNSRRRFLDILSAAVASGVCCTFGSLLGSTVFSVEVVSASLGLGQLRKSFVCSTVAALVTKKLATGDLINLFNVEDFVQFDWNMDTLALCVTIGIAIGFLSSAYVTLYMRVARWSGQYEGRLFAFITVSIAAILCVSLSYIMPILRMPLNTSISALFTHTSDEIRMNPDELLLSNGLLFGDGGKLPIPLVILLLVSISVVKLILTAICIDLRIPTGTYTPLILIGAGFGRAFGEMLYLISPGYHMNSPQFFSIMGAAAMAGATTQTLSTAVIMLELTGIMDLSIPILCTVIAATTTMNCFTPSIYAAVILARTPKALMSTPSPFDKKTLRRRQIGGEKTPATKPKSILKLSDRDETNFNVADTKASAVCSEIIALPVRASPQVYDSILLYSSQTSFPVINHQRILVGDVRRSALSAAIRRYRHSKPTSGQGRRSLTGLKRLSIEIRSRLSMGDHPDSEKVMTSVEGMNSRVGDESTPLRTISPDPADSDSESDVVTIEPNPEEVEAMLRQQNKTYKRAKLDHEDVGDENCRDCNGRLVAQEQIETNEEIRKASRVRIIDPKLGLHPLTQQYDYDSIVIDIRKEVLGAPTFIPGDYEEEPHAIQASMPISKLRTFTRLLHLNVIYVVDSQYRLLGRVDPHLQKRLFQAEKQDSNFSPAIPLASGGTKATTIAE